MLKQVQHDGCVDERRIAFVVAMALAVSGCMAVPPTPPPAPVAPVAVKGPPVPPPLPAGVDRVMGKDAAALEALFGDADQDVREEGARKLQYASSVCVLDAYLYAKERGREPVVTWVDARQPGGDDIDRASCIAALSRRREAR